MASDVAVCDWLRRPGNDVKLHLVVVVRYKSAERSHMQLQFHPDFQREKVRKPAPQPLVRCQTVGLSKFDAICAGLAFMTPLLWLCLPFKSLHWSF